MTYVIKLEWLGGLDELPSEHAGRYVLRYDPDAHAGLGQVWSTAELGEAIHFPVYADAMRFYLQVSTVKPLRDDGKPNRPLTAFTVGILPVETQQ